VHLSFAQRGKIIEKYSGDGLMISTPAGSTGWSRSYGGVILPHNANLNVLTPLGNTFPREFHATVIPDKGRVHIKNHTTRKAPIDILVDNKPIVSMESRPFKLVIERATRGVRLLIEQSYRERWDAKIYEEQGMTLEE
jgi:NAD+ kinase